MIDLITLLIVLPLACAAIVALLPAPWRRGQLLAALIGCLVIFLLSLGLLRQYSPSIAGIQMEQRVAWIQTDQIHVSYHVGIDGISLFLVLLTTFTMPLAILASWNSIREKLRAYLVSLLLLETAMIGVFVSYDLILFYLFWELMLIPMSLLIGVWGGQRRIYAAIKFFLYTMAGSVLMLVAILALYFYSGARDFDLLRIQQGIATGQFVIGPQGQLLMFFAFFLAFAIKVPLFPFHTWLPDAHVEAPTAASVILAGILLKMGTFGMLRYCLPLFPEIAVVAAPYISILALIGIIYGALVAMVQPDIKRLVAYSSVSHLGYVVLGIFAFNLQGLHGATYQMLNHGLSTGALFLLVGMIYDRRHTREIADFGGLAHVMPVFSVFFLLATLSSIGLPGLNGFVGEFLVLQGAYLTSRWFAGLAAVGMVLSAVYMLWMYQRVFLGEVTHEENRSLIDLTLREKAILVPIVLLFVWMGMSSGTFLRRMDSSLQSVVERIEQAKAKMRPQTYRVDNGSPSR